METTTNNHPQAYVGTYGKYNNGDLNGAWIDLIKCGTYDNFLKECYKLHEDEGDNTELMIQDVMYLPDGLNFGEIPDKEDFDDIIKEYNEENESEQIYSTVWSDEDEKFADWNEITHWMPLQYPSA